MRDGINEETRMRVFALFNEVGIIHQLSRAMFEARLPRGVTVSHFSVLNHLVRVGDGSTPLALANAFQVPKTTMTHTLSGLENRGWIKMKSNPSDGRSKQVSITARGRAFRNRAIGLLDPDIGKLAQRVDLDALAALVPRLAALRAELDRMRD